MVKVFGYNNFYTELKRFFVKNRGLMVVAVFVGLFVAVFGCPFRTFLGVCCPGCGMTRAVMSVCRLDFAAAFYYHPLVWTLPIVGAGLMFQKRLPEGLVTAGVIGFSALFIVCYLYRLSNERYVEVVYLDVRQSLLFKLYQEYITKVRRN